VLKANYAIQLAAVPLERLRMIAMQDAIRDLTNSDEDFEKIWQMWQTIFPKWPIERQRMEKILRQLPGQHYIYEKGFCLSFLTDGSHGKIAAVGVLPEYRGKGLGDWVLPS
jgi:beta-N-acetylhexosaminidase